MVDVAISIPSFASSLRMRGAPQVTFALDIFRIRPTSWRSNARRPPRPVRLLRVQKRLNPSRCHRTTVAGWTIARACRHACQRRARTTHTARSQPSKRGRRSPRARVRTPIWCRRARFSKASSPFVRKEELAVLRIVRIKLHTRATLPAQHVAAHGDSRRWSFREAQPVAPSAPAIGARRAAPHTRARGSGGRRTERRRRHGRWGSSCGTYSHRQKLGLSSRTCVQTCTGRGAWAMASAMSSTSEGTARQASHASSCR